MKRSITLISLAVLTMTSTATFANNDESFAFTLPEAVDMSTQKTPFTLPLIEGSSDALIITTSNVIPLTLPEMMMSSLDVTVFTLE